jgi:pyrroloquinoline quinone biosynthesis protein E
MSTELNVTEQLAAAGLRVSVDARRNSAVITFLPGADPLRGREIILRALDGLERHFSVFIKGPPPCFLLGAWDHAVSPSRGAGFTRVPACPACALKSLCPGVKKDSPYYALRGGLAPVLPVPRELVFELTGKCNLRCRTCFAPPDAGERQLPELMSLLREARTLGTTDIRFTGGEPFLSPNFLPLLKAAKKMGFYTLVNTNACAAPAALVRKIAPLMDNVLVSLQGFDRRSEARATGTDGFFRLKLDNMRLLRGCVPVFRLGTVASPELIADFGDFHKLATALKADVWEIYRPMLHKNAAGKAGPAVSARDIKRLSIKINELKPGVTRVLLANPLPLCLVPPAERSNLLGAAFDDGHTRLVYDPRGYFKPSYYIDLPLSRDMSKAWRSAYMRELKSFSWLPRRCSACAWLLKCLSGSRFQARLRRGTYFAADPWLPRAGARK